MKKTLLWLLCVALLLIPSWPTLPPHRGRAVQADTPPVLYSRQDPRGGGNVSKQEYYSQHSRVLVKEWLAGRDLHDILANLVWQRAYQYDVFDCTEQVAFMEWVAENAGHEAQIWCDEGHCVTAVRFEGQFRIYDDADWDKEDKTKSLYISPNHPRYWRYMQYQYRIQTPEVDSPDAFVGWDWWNQFGGWPPSLDRWPARSPVSASTTTEPVMTPGRVEVQVFGNPPSDWIPNEAQKAAILESGIPLPDTLIIGVVGADVDKVDQNVSGFPAPAWTCYQLNNSGPKCIEPEMDVVLHPKIWNWVAPTGWVWSEMYTYNELLAHEISVHVSCKVNWAEGCVESGPQYHKGSSPYYPALLYSLNQADSTTMSVTPQLTAVPTTTPEPTTEPTPTVTPTPQGTITSEETYDATPTATLNAEQVYATYQAKNNPATATPTVAPTPTTTPTPGPTPTLNPDQVYATYTTTVTPRPTVVPTAEPTVAPTVKPTVAPTTEPETKPMIAQTFDVTRWPADIRRYKQSIARWSTYYNVDPHLVAAVIDRESGGNPNAISRSGAVGLMQVMPSDTRHKPWLFTNRPTTAELINSPDLQIRWGTMILAQCIVDEGTVWSGLACYLGSPNLEYQNTIIQHWRVWR